MVESTRFDTNAWENHTCFVTKEGAIGSLKGERGSNNSIFAFRNLWTTSFPLLCNVKLKFQLNDNGD